METADSARAEAAPTTTTTAAGATAASRACRHPPLRRTHECDHPWRRLGAADGGVRGHDPAAGGDVRRHSGRGLGGPPALARPRLLGCADGTAEVMRADLGAAQRRPDDPDRHRGGQRQGTPRHAGLPPAEHGIPRAPRGRRGDTGGCRCRGQHAPPRRPRRLEHPPGGRGVGADLPECPLPLPACRLRLLESGQPPRPPHGRGQPQRLRGQRRACRPRRPGDAVGGTRS